MARWLAALSVGLVLVVTGCTKQDDCKGTAQVCDGSCVELRSDVENCGACNNACAAGEVCSNGACALTCQAGLVNCGGKCVDPNGDRDFCGASGACTGTASGAVCASGEVCSAGACTTSCLVGEYACGGRCVDPASDPNYCGARSDCTGGVVCGVGQACKQAICADVLCNWTPVTALSLASAPADGLQAGGTDGSQGAAPIAGRTAWTTSSHWMTLLVPAGLTAADDLFAAQVDLFWPGYASPESFVGLVALADHAADPTVPDYLSQYGELQGVWSGWHKAAGYLVEWRGPPTPLPSTGWRASGEAGYSRLLGAAVGASPEGGWRTLRIEGSRSRCALRLLLDGVVISTMAGPCDLSGQSIGLRAWNEVGTSLAGIGWSNLRVDRGAGPCLP